MKRAGACRKKTGKLSSWIVMTEFTARRPTQEKTFCKRAFENVKPEVVYINRPFLPSEG